MQIETERLVLRRWRDDDLDALALIELDPVVSCWLGARSLDDVARKISRAEASWERLGYGRFAVEEGATGELVGRVGVMRQDDWPATVEKDEIGWVIRPDRWGAGYAREAARAALADARDRVGVARVLSWAESHNEASLRVMEAVGLVPGGRIRWHDWDMVWCSTPVTWRPPQA